MAAAAATDTAVRNPSPRGYAVRRLWPGDAALVRDHFRRLDPETRANRFLGAQSEAGAAAYAARAVSAEGVMYGAIIDGALRGLAELRPMERGVGFGAPRWRLGPRAEAAFAVERAYRRRGLGAALFARIARGARNRGVAELHVRCLARNGPMLRLAAREGLSLRRDGLEADGALRLPRATPFSFWWEGVAEALDLTLAIGAAGRAAEAA